MGSETKIGSYFIEELIGRGGMGVVYKGRHAKLPRKVAIKSIAARKGGDLRRLRHRFEREAYIQSQLDHAGIVKIYDYIVAEQTYFIVMELVEGRSLAQLIAQEGGALDAGRALDLFEQILAAVAYAHDFVYTDEQGTSHRGIIHRDLKPHNVLVAPGGQVKITDFGIVKLVGVDTTEASGSTYGSPRYVSPEQASDAPVDQRSDIYSLGVILYEMLTGQPPFGGDGENLSRTEILRAHVERNPRPPSELNPRITPELQRVVCRALEKKPERRFATAADFLRAVRKVRGRNAGDDVATVAQSSAATASPAAAAAVAGEVHAATQQAGHDSYITQPIHGSFCEACGAETEADEQKCRVCGHDLSASPSTSRLARREYTARQSSRALRLGVPLVLLLVLGLGVVYFVHARRARDGGAPEQQQQQQPAPAASPVSTATPAPPESLVAIRPARVEVDSSFDGYGAEPLTDGVLDVRRIASTRYNRGNWASAETPVPHWVELVFERPERIAAVYIYWGFDRSRYMPSRRVELQTLDESGAWRTVSTLKPGDDYDRTAFEFAPVETSRVRIFQPAQQGPTGRPFVMWVREVQVFGITRPATPS